MQECVCVGGDEDWCVCVRARREGKKGEREKKGVENYSTPCVCLPHMLHIPSTPALPPGVKNLLAGEQQAAVTVAVEQLMGGAATPDKDDMFAYFDPKVCME